MKNTIIFDVGNVLLEYRWLEALMEAGVTDEDIASKAGRAIFDKKWVEFDAGILDLDGICEELGKEFPDIADNLREFIVRGERMVIHRPEVWEKVHILKEKGYKIYLLSNYSDYLFNLHTKGCSFMDDIDGRLVSYEVHMVKPNRDIYEELITRFNLNPSDCVFLDDREENTETARKVGIEAITIISREHINEVLTDFIENGVQ